MFVDLHYECQRLRSNTTEERSNELANNISPASICAVGGFPIIRRDTLTWCGRNVNAEVIRSSILEALGLSAVLTYTNKSNKSLRELGSICKQQNHLWGLHWVNVSILLSGFPPEVEMAFARDSRFRLSWTIKPNVVGKVFVATAGIKEWIDYLGHKDDLSFDNATRVAMKSCHKILAEIMP